MTANIEVALGVTINTGNFESIRVDYREGRTVADGEDVEAAREELYNVVDDFISEKVQEIRKDLS